MYPRQVVDVNGDGLIDGRATGSWKYEYTTSGVFTVKCTAKNAAGEYSVTKKDAITMTPTDRPPQAA